MKKPKRRGRGPGKRGSYKSIPIKCIVWELYAAGETYATIAARLKITQNCVMNIVHEKDWTVYTKQTQELTKGLSMAAVGVLAEKMLDDGWLAYKILERNGGFPDPQPKQIQMEMIRGVDAAELGMTKEQRKEALVQKWMANFARMAYERSVVYEQPLPELEPPDFDAEIVAEEAKKKEKK
jgi:hypothetical protein